MRGQPPGRIGVQGCAYISTQGDTQCLVQQPSLSPAATQSACRAHPPVAKVQPGGAGSTLDWFQVRPPSVERATLTALPPWSVSRPSMYTAPAAAAAAAAVEPQRRVSGRAVSTQTPDWAQAHRHARSASRQAQACLCGPAETPNTCVAPAPAAASWRRHPWRTTARSAWAAPPAAPQSGPAGHRGGGRGGGEGSSRLALRGSTSWQSFVVDVDT